MSNEALPIAMATAVPLYIMQLQDKGGPDTKDMERARVISDKLGERGDVLLHGSEKKGECAEMFNETARAIAVLAFVSGGVNIFGQHFEAKK